MKKIEIIEKIVERVEEIDIGIVRVYGVSHGVGYDMTGYVYFDNGKSMLVEAHAVRASWACLGHLRPDNPYYKYTGSNDVYQDDVIKYWKEKHGFREYLGRWLKPELVDLYGELFDV